MSKRTVRLNSLLKEVISEVIRRDIHHSLYMTEFVTITRVDITNDLSFAKVYVSVIGDEKQKVLAVEALQHHARQIALLSRKKVTMRLFPHIEFELDASLEKQFRIEELLHKVSEERAHRQVETDTEEQSYLNGITLLDSLRGHYPHR